MIKFISPEPPGDQRNPALSTISPADFPAPPCPCPCTVGPSLVKLLPRHRVVHPTADSSKFWISACSWITIPFNLVSSLSKSLTTFLVPTSSSAASSLESYLGHLFLQQCGFHLFWFNFQKLQSLLSFLLIFPTVSTATCLKMANIPLTHFWPLRNTLKILAAQIIKNEQSRSLINWFVSLESV